MAEKKTRIILRNDTHGNWEAVKDTVVLLKGEVGIEFVTNADSFKPRMKIGDGVSVWSALPYFGEDRGAVYQVEASVGQDHLEAIAAVCATPVTGDMAIVKEALAEGLTQKAYTAYIYTNSAWAAMDGNYDANNVYLTQDITLAGDYTQVGNLTKTKTGTAVFATKGKSIASVLTDIFFKRLQPSITANPAAGFTAYSGISNMTVEPGYTANGTVSYTLALTGTGSYTYGPETGVTESGTYSITYDDGSVSGQTLSTKSGQFTYNFVVGTSNKTVKVTAASVGYTEGAIAHDNNGDLSDPVVRIAAGNASAGTKTNTFTSSRKSFWATDTTIGTVLHANTTEAAEKAADSNLIRALAKNEFGVKKTYSLKVESGSKRIIIAVPGVVAMTECIDVEGMGLDVKSNFTTYTNSIYVGGCDATADNIGDYETKYTVFVWEDPATIAAHTYNIKLN